MTDTYVINTVFKSHDQMTSTVSRLTDKMSLFGKRSENSFRRATLGATRFKTVLGGVLGANLITAGINQLRMGIGAVTTEFLDFDNAVTSAASKWGIERGTTAFKELGTVARDVAKVTPKTAGEAGSALDFLAMAGFNAQQAMAALPGVTQLSIASQTDLARSSDIVSDALSSLGLMTTNSTKLTENLNRVNDVFVKTTTTSNTNLEMLFESMKMVAPVASNLGAEVEGLSAMIGTLANSGIKASMSGTALRNMYLRLTSGTEGAGKVLKKYNIKILDPHTKKMRNMIDILEEVKQKTKHLNDEKKQAAYTDLFGARAVASATVLMQAGGKALHEYEERLKGATGETKRMAEAMGKSWTNRIAALKSRLIELGLTIYDTFKDKIEVAFTSFQTVLDNINVSEIVEKVQNIIGFFKKYSKEIELLVVGIVTYNSVVKIATVLQGIFNAVMLANPVGLLIASFAALGTVVIMFYRNWDIISKRWKEDISSIGRWIDDHIATPLSNISNGFNKIFKSLGFKGKKTVQEIQKEYDTSSKMKEKGYILGGGGNESTVQKALQKREKEQNEIGDVLSKYSSFGGVNQSSLFFDQAEKQTAQIQDYLKDFKVDKETAAYIQKIQLNGEFNFKNPPKGMTFKQNNKGAPSINTNLGKN